MYNFMLDLRKETMSQGHHNMKAETTIETAKAVPAVGGAMLYSFTLNEAVALATLIYIVLQVGYLIWKWRREAARDR